MKTTLSFLTISSLFVLASCGQTNQPIPDTNTPDTKTESPSDQTVIETTNTLGSTDVDTTSTLQTNTLSSTTESDVFYHTDFNSDDGHWHIETEAIEGRPGVSGLENGRMWIAGNHVEGGYYLPLIKDLDTFTAGKNFSFETKFKIMKATDRVEITSTFGGILFDEIYDANNNLQEVRFFALNTETGEYGIFSSAPQFGAATTSIVGITKSDLINKGEADNIVKIEWRDGTMDFFINGTKVHSMEYRHPVRVGLDVGALMGGGFDYVTIAPLK